jgi:hypothetical protein
MGLVRTSVAGATPWSAIDAGARPVPPGKKPRCQQAEDEPADLGEERHAAAVSRGAEQLLTAS